MQPAILRVLLLATLAGSGPAPLAAQDPATTSPAPAAAEDQAGRTGGSSAAGPQQRSSHQPAPGYRRFVTEMFAVDVPEHWREMLPNESVLLDLPADFPPIRPGWAHVLGDVDRWAESGYDGEALVAMVSGEFEAPTDAEQLARIEEHWRNTTLGDGSTREVVRGEITEVGQTDHPCLELEVVTDPVSGRPERCLEYHASTRGRELILSFRAWDDEFAESEARLRGMAATLTFPRPPRTPEDLGDRLFDAALVGGAVGLILIGLRYIARQRGRRG